MVSSVQHSGKQSIKTVNLSFKLPYYTQWGQSLLVCGSEPVLGLWNVKKGLVLSPFHEGEELIWCGRIAVPSGFECEYSYYLVDDNKNVLRWEAGKKRKLSLPEGIPNGEVVELHDLWQVCAPSCHDCSTLRAWWEEDEERRCRFYKTVVGSNEMPPVLCTPDVTYFIIRQHVEAPSMWAIFPLQDLLALKEEYTARPAVEETINDPTNPKHYWRYRVHVTLESLLGDKDLQLSIRDLVRGSEDHVHMWKDLKSKLPHSCCS